MGETLEFWRWKLGLQKAGRARAECARQGGETPSLRGPGIRGACIQGFGPKKKKKTDYNTQWSGSSDVLILAAKNLNKFRFQTNIWSAMTMVRVKCSEHNFHIASFSAEQVVIKWRRRYYWSRVRRGKRSIICTRKIYLIYSFWKSVSWSFFQQRKRSGSIKLLPSTEAVWCHYNFFQ